MLKYYISIITILTVIVARAQNTSTSPYSSYGIGDIGGLDHAVFSGIGNNTITYFDSTVINFYNPSSYSSLSKGMVLFSIGAASKFSTFSSGESTATSRVFALDHAAMAIPFGGRFGMSFGIKPFSKRGYEIQGENVLTPDTINYQYKGSGTTSEVFYGLSAYLIKTKKHLFSLGANVGYIFGTVENDRISTINNSSSGGVETTGIRIKSVHYSIGAHYQIHLDTIGRHTLMFTATYDPEQKLKSYYNKDLYFASDVSDETTYLALNQIDEKGKIRFGSVTTVGMRYSLKTTPREKVIKTHISQLDLFASYNINNYERFFGDFETFTVNYGYKNTNSLNIGLQYTPEVRLYDKSVNTKYLSLIHYRVGIYKNSLPLKINTQTITDFGTTFGFGLPILSQNSVSNVNFGFTYGRRGRDVPGAVNENYFGINFGITISPSRADRWFVKRKLD